MRILLILSLLLFSFYGKTQITVDKNNHDFGEIYAQEETYVDFVFTNNTQKNHFLFRVDKPRQVFYLFSSKSIPKDSSIIIRLKVDDSRAGKFDYTVNVYFSANQKPIPIRLKGNIMEVTQNALNECPDFSNTPPTASSTNFKVTIKVIDSLTRKPIKNSQVYLVERGEMVGKYKTNSKGLVQREIPLGLYYITANHVDYNSNYFEGYLNFKRNVVVIPLGQKKRLRPAEEEIKEEEVVEEEIVIETKEEPEIEIYEEEQPIEIVNNDPTPLEELPDSLFDEKHFKYTNITFILDVSTSMSASGRLGLLRLSMIELTKILRPNDIVSIIKYASETEVILKNTSGAKKEKITTTVKELKASGLTAGGNAIKLGYKINRKAHIENGNNIVIMITDGAFNKGDKNYLETIQNTYAKKGTRFSVIGIKMSEYLTPRMKDIVAKGGGSFVQIRTIEEAQNKLITEIKRTAFISP